MATSTDCSMEMDYEEIAKSVHVSEVLKNFTIWTNFNFFRFFIKFTDSIGIVALMKSLVSPQ